MLELLYGLPKSGKSAAMLEKIKTDAETNKKVLVIVPDQFTFEYERLLYDKLGIKLFNNGNVEVFSFGRLAEDIFGSVLSSHERREVKRESADHTAKLAIMYRCIKTEREKGSLRYFVKQASRAGFTNTVLTMITELIHSGVTPEELDKIRGYAENTAGLSAAAEKLGDIYLLYSAYDAELKKLGLRDTLEDVRLAAAEAAAAGYFKGRNVYINLFKSFTGDQFDMLSAIMQGADSLTFCACTDSLDHKPDSNSMFAPVCGSCRRLVSIAEKYGRRVHTTECTEKFHLSPMISYIAGSAHGNIRKSYTEKPDGSVRIISAPDLHGECEFVCAEIKRLVSEDKNLKYSDIAVLSRNMNSDISVLSSYMDRYGIPFYSDKKPSASHMPLTMAVKAALELASAPVISTETVLRYAKTGLVGTTRKITENGETKTDSSGRITPKKAADLERFCYVWDINGDMWDMDSYFPDEHCDAVRKTLLAPVFRLRKKREEPLPCKEICKAVRAFITETGLEKNAIYKNAENKGLDSYRADAKKIADKINGIFLSMEKAIEDNITLKEFYDIFSLAADNITLSMPPMTLDGVLAQQSDLARLTDVKAVFVIHAAEGMFPYSTGDSKTFTERERALFAENDRDLSGSMKKRGLEEKFNAYNAVCAPLERLYISFSAADPSGARLTESSFVSGIEKSLGITAEPTEKMSPVFFCRTPDALFRTCASRYADGGFCATAKKVLTETDSAYKNKFDFIESMESRSGSQHKVTPSSAAALAVKNNSMSISPTDLDRYRQCHFIYCCEKILSLSVPYKKNLSDSNWGTIAHAALQNVLTAHFPKDAPQTFTSLTDAALAAAVTLECDNYIRDHMGGNIKRAPEFATFRKNLEANVTRCLIKLRNETADASPSYTPAGFEIKMRKVIQPASTGLPDIVIGGICDRADIFTDSSGTEYVRIIDYKTGKLKSLTKKDVEEGRNLQPIIYLDAIRSTPDPRYKDRFKDCKYAGTLFAPIRSVSRVYARDPADKDLNSAVGSSTCMTGMYLSSGGAFDAMRAGPADDPATCVSDDSAKSYPASEQDITDAIKTAEKTVITAASSILSGDFTASPEEEHYPRHNSPCEKCVFSDLCPDTRGIVRRYPSASGGRGRKKAADNDGDNGGKGKTDGKTDEKAPAKKEGSKRASKKKDEPKE